jgi:ankyrin repeat protein
MRYIALFLLPVLTAFSLPIAPPECTMPELRLFFFTCDGDVEGIDAALAEGADINALVDGSCTALQLSIFQDNEEVFDHLLKLGADPHVFSKFGGCDALSIATIYNRKAMAEKLLKLGVDPNAVTYVNYEKSYSAIAYAALYGNVELLKRFEADGGDLKQPIKWGMWRDLPGDIPLLTVAAQHGGLEVVRFLVEERGHSVNRAEKGPDLPPLSVAVKYNNLEVAKYLISKGADVNAVGHDHYQNGNYWDQYVSTFLSPLGVAARYGRLDMVKLLFAHGARIRDDVKESENPVHLADWGGFASVVKEFERQGYTTTYWNEIVKLFQEQHAQTQPQTKKIYQSSVLEFDSKLAVTFLDGYEREWGKDDENLGADELRVAIIGDDASGAMVDLLSVELSLQDSVSLVERSDLEAVLDEHRLNRAALTDGKTLQLISNLLGAQAVVFVDTHQAKEKKVFRIRLVDAAMGLQYGQQYATDDPMLILPSVEAFAADFMRVSANFTRNFKSAVPLALVNVRANLGSANGLKAEFTLKRLLEHQLVAQQSILLTQRDSLQKLELEKDLNETEEGFVASAAFVDIGVNLDEDGESVKSYLIRVRSADGKNTKTRIGAQGGALREDAAIIVQSIVRLIDAEYSTTVASVGDLSRDATVYQQEALWYMAADVDRQALESMRTAIALGYNTRMGWSQYLEILNVMLEERCRQHRGDDNNNKEIIELERERVVALDGYFRLYGSDVPDSVFRMPSAFHFHEVHALDGLAQSFYQFRPVAMQRRYAKELKGLENAFLKLVTQQVVPLYLGSSKDARRFRGQSSSKDLVGHFVAVFYSIPALSDYDYGGAFHDLLGSYDKAYPAESIQELYVFQPTPSLLGSLYAPLIDRAIFESTYSQSMDVEEGSLYAMTRLMAHYSDSFNHYMSPPNPVSVRGRNALGLILSDVAVPDAKSESKKLESLCTWLVANKLIGLDLMTDWKPREGTIPLGFEVVFDFESKAYELARIEYEKLTHKGKTFSWRYPFQRASTMRMALEVFETWLSAERLKRQKPTVMKDELRQLEMRLQLLEGGEADEGLRIAELPIQLWQASKFGCPDVYASSGLFHEPIFDGQYFWVLAKLDSWSEPGYALLKIDSETLETQVRKFSGFPKPRKELLGVAQAGGWLAFGFQGYEIILLNCETLEVRRLTNYIPSVSRGAGSPVIGYKERLFCLISPDYETAAGQGVNEDTDFQMFVCYDPSSEAREVIYNTRRKPAQTPLDSGGKLQPVLLEGDGVFLARRGRNVIEINCETLKVNKRARGDLTRAYNLGTPWNHSDKVVSQDLLWAYPWRLGAAYKQLLPDGGLPLLAQDIGLGRIPHADGDKRALKVVMPTASVDDICQSVFDQVKMSAPLDKFRRYGDIGFIDYSRSVKGQQLWGFFKISDLEIALEQSSNLLD